MLLFMIYMQFYDNDMSILFYYSIVFIAGRRAVKGSKHTLRLTVTYNTKKKLIVISGYSTY